MYKNKIDASHYIPGVARILAISLWVLSWGFKGPIGEAFRIVMYCLNRCALSCCYGAVCLNHTRHSQACIVAQYHTRLLWRIRYCSALGRALGIPSIITPIGHLDQFPSLPIPTGPSHHSHGSIRTFKTKVFFQKIRIDSGWLQVAHGGTRATLRLPRAWPSMSAVFLFDQVLGSTESATSKYSTSSQCLNVLLGRRGRVKFIIEGLR